MLKATAHAGRASGASAPTHLREAAFLLLLAALSVVIGRGSAMAASATADAPAAPTGLTAAAGNASVTLRWNDPADASVTGYEYQVRWDGVAWQEWTAIHNSGASTTTFTLSGLVNGTEYRFHLRALNAHGAGKAAPDAAPWYVAATPLEPPTPTPTNTPTPEPGPAPPAAPSGLTAAAGNASVTLRWNDPADASITGYQYQVRWAGVAWQEWTAIHNGGASTTSFTLSGLDNGTEYRFHLRAVNLGGAGKTAPDAEPW